MEREKERENETERERWIRNTKVQRKELRESFSFKSEGIINIVYYSKVEIS